MLWSTASGARLATSVAVVWAACAASPHGTGRSTPLNDMTNVVGSHPIVDAGPHDPADVLPSDAHDSGNEPSDPPSDETQPLTSGRPPVLTPRIPAEEYDRATQPIVDPAGSMTFFHKRLSAVARQEPGVLARISVYSDSINGADAITSSIRRAMQKRFGDGGKGWITVGAGWPTQHHRDVRWRHQRAWLAHVVNRGQGPGHRYGLGGVMSYNRTRHSKAFFGTVVEGPVGTAVSRYRVFYQAWPRGGDLSLSVDEGNPVVVETYSGSLDDRVYDLEVADGPHTLEVGVVDGRLRLYGVVMEREGPGVVVDGLMLIGARGRRLALFDAEHLGRQVDQRGTDLLVFWMGGNDAESSYFDRDGFIADYGVGIAAARAGRPEASCLVVSILDIGESPGGRTRRRVPTLVAAQREMAEAQACAFLDFYQLMGGAGSMRRWYRSRPRLVSGDYIHPTLQGAHEVGQLFYQAILRDYDEHLAGGAIDASIQEDIVEDGAAGESP